MTIAPTEWMITVFMAALKATVCATWASVVPMAWTMARERVWAMEAPTVVPTVWVTVVETVELAVCDSCEWKAAWQPLMKVSAACLRTSLMPRLRSSSYRICCSAEVMSMDVATCSLS